MNYNPEIHHRKSIRLKGYDYSKKGVYYITTNQKDRVCLYGKIVDDEMVLYDAGIMVNKWWEKIPEKFPDIELGVYQIMPNHFHAIVINNGVGANPRVRPNESTINATVGANPRVRPNDNNTNATVGANPRVRPNDPTVNATVGANPRVRPNSNAGQTHGSAPTNNEPEQIEGEHTGSPLRDVMQWFKTISTNEYIRGVKSLGWKPFYGKLL